MNDISLDCRGGHAKKRRRSDTKSPTADLDWSGARLDGRRRRRCKMQLWRMRVDTSLSLAHYTAKCALRRSYQTGQNDHSATLGVCLCILAGKFDGVSAAARRKRNVHG